MLRQDLQEARKQLEILRKAHEELQESHSSLRQEMINIRKNNLDRRFASQNTLVNEESNLTTLKEQIEQLRTENLNLSRTSEQHIQLLKVKMNNQRSEYSAKVYELEQKLKGKKYEGENMRNVLVHAQYAIK
jgi:DNA repair exonuclease SbcCD ATPase subunit